MCLFIKKYGTKDGIRRNGMEVDAIPRMHIIMDEMGMDSLKTDRIEERGTRSQSLGVEVAGRSGEAHLRYYTALLAVLGFSDE